MASSAISNLLAVFNTNASELPPAVRFIPAAYLFVHAEPLPDGMQPSELDGFAGVTLEGLSPLPLEQIAWGYVTDEKSQRILIFGAFRDRLAADNLAPDDSFYHVLPSFFAAAPTDGAAHWVFLWEAGHVAALHYGAGELVPSQIEFETLKEDTVAEAFAARENLLKRLSTHSRTEASAGLLARPDAARGSRDRLAFSFSHYASPEAEPTRVEGHAPATPVARWTADLRGGIFRAAEQKRRRATHQAAFALKFFAACGLVLFVLQLAVFGGQIWVKNADSKLALQKPDVDLIDERVSLLKQITQFTDHQLHPFEMIGVINSMRPASVVFQKTSVTDNPIKMTIMCKGTDANEFRDFIQSLTNSGLVALDASKIPVSTAIGGRISFQLNLGFNQIPAAEALPPEKPVPPPGPTPEELQAQADQAAADQAAQQQALQAQQPAFQAPPPAQPPADVAPAPATPTPAAAEAATTDAAPVDNTPPAGPTIY